MMMIRVLLLLLAVAAAEVGLHQPLGLPLALMTLPILERPRTVEVVGRLLKRPQGLTDLEEVAAPSYLLAL